LQNNALGKNGRSLRVAFVHIVISLTAVVFFVIVLILAWFFPKKDIPSRRVIRTVCVEALWTY
jgi:cytochrome bd-type quinol oxidase subunit 1